jgi:hypothetical protein
MIYATLYKGLMPFTLHIPTVVALSDGYHGISRGRK